VQGNGRVKKGLGRVGADDDRRGRHASSAEVDMICITSFAIYASMIDGAR
jgi:hypothetical protein